MYIHVGAADSIANETGRMRVVLVRLLFVMILLLSGVDLLQAQVVSGDYEGLLIGVDTSGGTITGYYESFSGLDEATGKPRFSCIFYLKGSMNGPPPYTIDTWFPADKTRKNLVTGSLTPEESEGVAVLKIKLPKEHGGCWNVEHFADGGGVSFRLEDPGKWVNVRVVSAPRAYFHDDAADAKKRKAYVIKGNPLRIFETRPGWVYAGFTAEGKTTAGWIKETDLFSTDPPAK
jgi:hypothetical protein